MLKFFGMYLTVIACASGPWGDTLRWALQLGLDTFLTHQSACYLYKMESLSAMHSRATIGIARNIWVQYDRFFRDKHNTIVPSSRDGSVLEAACTDAVLFIWQFIGRRYYNCSLNGAPSAASGRCACHHATSSRSAQCIGSPMAVIGTSR